MHVGPAGPGIGTARVALFLSWVSLHLGLHAAHPSRLRASPKTARGRSLQIAEASGRIRSQRFRGAFAKFKEVPPRYRACPGPCLLRDLRGTCLPGSAAALGSWSLEATQLLQGDWPNVTIPMRRGHWTFSPHQTLKHWPSTFHL